VGEGEVDSKAGTVGVCLDGGGSGAANVGTNGLLVAFFDGENDGTGGLGLDCPGIWGFAKPPLFDAPGCIVTYMYKEWDYYLCVFNILSPVWHLYVSISIYNVQTCMLLYNMMQPPIQFLTVIHSHVGLVYGKQVNCRQFIR
jgi:hypothetical protein